ncbi:hypothetical protein CSC17_0275 [Klebsiella oxytoca]|nr:hypothetical protein CSC17_0275 [Klebsiella oxytoca]
MTLTTLFNGLSTAHLLNSFRISGIAKIIYTFSAHHFQT